MNQISWVVCGIVALAAPLLASVGECEATGERGRCVLALANSGQAVIVERFEPDGTVPWRPVASTTSAEVSVDGGGLYRVCRAGGAPCDTQAHWVPILPQGVDEIPSHVQIVAGRHGSAIISKNLGYAEQVYQYNSALAARMLVDVRDCEALPVLAPPIVDPFAFSDRRSWERALFEATRPFPALQETAELSRHAFYQEYEGCRRDLPDWL
ncbi:MAG: hypothetical protein AAGA68_08325 [Pseudomonadota bacterium]